MLTVSYDRLGMEAGDLVLDIGAGGGRHAFEAFRRGATVVAADLSLDELRGCNNTFMAMADAGENPPGAGAASVQTTALALPFADGAFDRVIASEVLEHIGDDTAALAELARVLRPGGTIAVTVPAWLAESVCWRLSEDYHAPNAPGGHVRIYTASVLRARLRGANLRPEGQAHAHGLHTPYWWLRCAVGVGNEGHLLVRAYHRALVWDIVRRPRLTRWLDAAMNPVLGKSLVVYATKLALPTDRPGQADGTGQRAQADGTRQPGQSDGAGQPAQADGTGPRGREDGAAHPAGAGPHVAA